MMTDYDKMKRFTLSIVAEGSTDRPLSKVVHMSLTELLEDEYRFAMKAKELFRDALFFEGLFEEYRRQRAAAQWRRANEEESQ